MINNEIVDLFFHLLVHVDYYEVDTSIPFSLMSKIL